MPYKDKEKQKEYQRLWAQKKRDGVETKIVNKPKLTDEELKEKRSKDQKIWKEKDNKSKKEYLISKYSDDCFICKLTDAYIIHRKDGKEHKKFGNLSLKQTKEELEGHENEYVRLCMICHKGVHWCMKYQNLTWKEIIWRCGVNG